MALQVLSEFWSADAVHDGVVVELSQEVLDSRAVWVLFDELFELAVDSGLSTLYVDFQNVRRLASIVFGKLITLDKKLRDIDCRLIICNPDPFVYQSFRAARITENLDIRFGVFPQA
jgi:anti-anti-sigma regulatory factor